MATLVVDDDDDDDNRAIFALDGDDVDVVVVIVVVDAVVVNEGLCLDDDAVVHAATVVCSLKIPSDMYCFSRIFFRQLYRTSTC